MLMVRLLLLHLMKRNKDKELLKLWQISKCSKQSGQIDGISKCQVVVRVGLDKVLFKAFESNKDQDG